jgi:hypothetical protein
MVLAQCGMRYPIMYASTHSHACIHALAAEQTTVACLTSDYVSTGPSLLHILFLHSEMAASAALRLFAVLCGLALYAAMEPMVPQGQVRRINTLIHV